MFSVIVPFAFAGVTDNSYLIGTSVAATVVYGSSILPSIVTSSLNLTVVPSS